MAVSKGIKESTYDHFVANADGRLPTDLTFARLKRVRPVLLDSKEYNDELQRHGLLEKNVYTLRDNDPFTYNHLRGNFWSMCLDVWFQLQKSK